ncbi:Adrenodoxin, mitochondrial [Araneus ventricosus]|uniref:Adrenodoxin, mitochondrial n=1 Tax=Araneus ventricosus TaxID=182803 RepID=A0A4Y2LS08_ARAVE|nr:Adrenodoxin, mitochondrial [Araneus ventricosus]
MSFSGFRALYNSYRSIIFSASNQTKFISRTNVQLKANFLRHYCSESITVTFKLPDGTLLKRSGKVGDTVRSTVEEDDPDFRGYGSCNGGISCRGCHVILSEEDFDKLAEPSEEEADVLDGADFSTSTSRLACGMTLGPEMDGMVLKIPKLDKK